MKIFVGADHAGFGLKSKLVPFLVSLGYEVEDKGAHEYNDGDDYPDFVIPVAREVAMHPNEVKGIILGGTGQGEAMCANRVPGVRAAIFYGEAIPEEAVDAKGRKSEDPYEIVKLARLHNNANILSIGVKEYVGRANEIEVDTIFELKELVAESYDQKKVSVTMLNNF